MDLEHVVKSNCCEQGLKDTKSRLEHFPGVLCPAHEICPSHNSWGGFPPNSEHFGPALKALAEHCRMAFRLFLAKNFSFVIWHQILSCHPAWSALLGFMAFPSFSW